MKVLVDTPIWSLALRRPASRLSPQEEKLKNLLSEIVSDGQMLIIGPIRQELLSGVREQSQFTRLRDLLRAFPDYALTAQEFERAAEMNNQCASRGVAATPVDMLICAVASATGGLIFSTDQDFRAYAKLLPIRLFQPTS